MHSIPDGNGKRKKLPVTPEYKSRTDCVDDFPGRAVATCDRAMDGAVVAGHVGGFSGKEQSVRNRSPKGLLGAVRSDLAIGVGSARKRIGLPIVEAHLFDFGAPQLQYVTAN